MNRVAIVGMGVVSAAGVGSQALEELLASGETGAAEITRFDTTGLSAHTAALVRDFRPKDFIPMMKLRRMNSLSRLGVAAAKLARDDAAMPFDPSRTGVTLGTAFGPVQTSVDYLDELIAKGASLAPPQLFAESVANAPASHVAIELGLRGLNFTFTQRESSALAALMFSATQILRGTIDCALTGGVEEMNEVTFAVLDRMRALSKATEQPERGRPFDRQRNGLVVGEGGAVFVLIREDAVAEREPYGWVTGVAIGRDRTAEISNWGRGAGAVAGVMRRAMEDAELDTSQIDAVWASANGSLSGDLTEGEALAQVFGSAMPPVVATKGAYGEYAAGGALQIASALLALRRGVTFPSAGFSEPDPAIGVVPTRTCEARAVRHVLVNSLSAGGGIVCVVLSSSGS